MTYPAVIRIFFAIDLPSLNKDKVGQFIVQLKKKAKTNAIRWTKPENLHITLQFLAEVKAEHLPQLIENVKTEVEGVIKKSTFSLGDLHLFPNPYRPRVIVLEIHPQEELAALSKLIGEGIKKSSYPIETRPFRAHLTLGRIKHPQDINLTFLSDSPTPEMENIAVEEVVLFRSEPRQEGSEYSVIQTIKF